MSSGAKSGAAPPGGPQSSISTRSQTQSQSQSQSSSGRRTMNSLSLLGVNDHHHYGRRGDKHLTFNVTSSSSDLKIAGSYLHEPKTPNDKLNTPRTVTVPNTFFPPSPTPFVDNDIGIEFFVVVACSLSPSIVN